MNSFKPASQDEISLFCFVGEALCSVQHIEDALSHSIVLKKEKKCNKAEADHLLKNYRSYTLGKAINIAKRAGLYSEQLQQELEAFLSERNWLVHKSIAQNRDDWDLNVSRDQLFRRVKAITNQAQRLQILIEEDLMNFSEANGVDMSRVRSEMKKYYAEGRR